MRRDVQKVISERPKSGRTWVSKTLRRKHPVLDSENEQLDSRSDGARRKRQKGRNSRPNVVERFLLNRVGRRWDDVFAEACSVADSRTFQGSEVREMMRWLVATGCWFEGRKLMHHDRDGCPKPVRGLFVHPRSGLLLRNDS